jgi:hypothetical protein
MGGRGTLYRPVTLESAATAGLVGAQKDVDMLYSYLYGRACNVDQFFGFTELSRGYGFAMSLFCTHAAVFCSICREKSSKIVNL